MEISVTKPIEEFIERQIAKGYANPEEVARQAFLRWMEEDEFDPTPPRILEKLEAARQGKFQTWNPDPYKELSLSADETRR